MSSLPVRVVIATLAAAVVFTSSSDAAKVRKYKKTAASSATHSADPQDRGTNVVRGGPLYFGGVYLGDDPDPNIRFQLLRDISGRFGGEP
jgi:hypothetical protein